MLETGITIMMMSWIALLSIGGAVVVYKRTEFQSPHRLFVYALIFRALLYLLSIFFIAYNFIHYGYDEINGVLSVRKLITALIFYAVFSIFPMTVICHNRGDHSSYKNISRRIITFIIPAAIVSIGYFVLCHVIGASPFERYDSLAEIWADRANPVVVGRIAVFVLLSSYIVYILYYMWRLEPIYTRYIKQTQSNENFNLSWMRHYFIALSVVYFSNVSIIVYTSPYSLPIYLAVAFLSYVVMIYLVVECKSFAPLEGLKIRFTLLKPILELEDCDCARERSAREKFAQFEEWIESSRPYRSSNFSLSDVLERFPTICACDISMVLQERGLKFQSYIRECRINYAIELIETSNKAIQLKEISFKVGFDNPASFSRAFRAVKGVSPVDYRNMSREGNTPR